MSEATSDEDAAAALMDAFRMLRNAVDPERNETPDKRRARVDQIIALACEPYGADPAAVRKALEDALR